MITFGHIFSNLKHKLEAFMTVIVLVGTQSA